MISGAKRPFFVGGVIDIFLTRKWLYSGGVSGVGVSADNIVVSAVTSADELSLSKQSDWSMDRCSDIVAGERRVAITPLFLSSLLRRRCRAILLPPPALPRTSLVSVDEASLKSKSLGPSPRLVSPNEGLGKDEVSNGAAISDLSIHRQDKRVCCIKTVTSSPLSLSTPPLSSAYCGKYHGRGAGVRNNL